jgi:phage-related protein
MANIPDITLTVSGYQVVYNPGSVFAEPVLKVTLSGDGSVAVGASYFELTGLSGTVTVDTPLSETYMDYASRNANMRGDYPRFLPGANLVRWSGGVRRIVITPNWRML